MELSSHSSRMKPSATLAINELINELRSKGKNISHLGFGESPFPVHPNISKALCEHTEETSYLATQGILPLREQISSFYKTMFGLEYSPEQIVVGPGSKSLIYAALISLEGPLFLPSPSWVSYQPQARSVGKDVFHIKTFPENSYRLTPDTLVQALQQEGLSKDSQKIMILNYPCNPTGQNFTQAELNEIAIVARENNIVIISDEVYALISYKDHKHHSIAEFYYEGTLVTGGLSKDRSLGGYRVGVLLLPDNETNLRQSILSFASNTWSCVSAPIQYAAIEAYSTDSSMKEYIEKCTSIHEIMTTYVYRRLSACEVRCPAPQGAFFLFTDWNEYRDALTKMGITTSSELAKHLLTNWSVATLPGSEFGMAPEDLCIRLTSVDYDGATALNYFESNQSAACEDVDEFVNTVAPRVVSACDHLEKFTISLR